MEGTRESLRYPVTLRRDCSFCIITFKDLKWQEHSATLVDISRQGVGLESDAAIDPGFVWFRGRLGGFRGGVLMWTRAEKGKHRAGIRFIQLSPQEEQFIQQQVERILAHKPLTNPVAVIATIMNALTGMSSVPSGSSSPSPGKREDDPLADIEDMMSKL